MTEPQTWWEDIVGDLVEILLELSEPGCARRMLDFYCDAVGDPRLRVGALVELRCRALLAADAGDLESALAVLDGAVAGAGADARSAALGRVLLARGGLLRVLGRTWEARSDLKRALAIFTRHAQAAWRAAALRALVGTVTEADPWTPALPDRVVSALTGGHWTDEEIAGRLHLCLLAAQREIDGGAIGDPPASAGAG